MAHITITQLNTILSRIVTWVTGKFAAKNVTSGKLEYSDMPVVVLASMGHELDGTDNDISVSVGDTYFLPAGVGTTPRIMYRPDSGNPVRISDPASGVIYCNAYTGLLYRWDASQAKMVSVGGTSGGSIDVSGKADMLAGTNMLTPSQWPKVVLRNVTDETVDDLASGDVYFDSGHLWLYRGGNQTPVDLDTPSNKTIYFCLADGKMYRWVSSSFQPVLSAVASSGSYNDLSNKPSIPTKISDLTDDSGFLDDEAVDNAIDTALSNYYDKSTINSTFATKLQVEQDLERKQDTLTFDDVPTAGHTTQVMSSDKIKTALDNLLQNLTIGQNGNWYVGQTDTGVKAQGPQGNCTITDASQMVSEIVNDLDTGGGNKFLSAEMGKKLKNALVTIYNALGDYAFLNGKPTIDLNAVVAVQVTVGSHVSYTSSGDTVSMGAALNVQLSTDNNLYVIDDDEVTVEMGGIDITSTAYIAAQNKIVISSVTDTVVITVGDAITYVSDGLVCMFDGKNRGGVAGEWTDLKDNTRKLILSQCGEYDDHVHFNGTNSTALAADTTVGVDVGDKLGTIEWVSNGHTCDSTTAYLNIIIPHRHEVSGVQTPVIAGMAMYSTLFNNGIGLSNYQTAPNIADIPNSWLMGKSSITESDALYISLSHTRAFKNGSTSLTRATQNNAKTYAGARANARFGILSYVKQDGSTASQKGNMYCMRIYGRTLDANEVLLNYKVDKKRFNI